MTTDNTALASPAPEASATAVDAATQHGGLSPAQFATEMQYGVDRGFVSVEKANAELEAHGMAPLEQKPAEAAVDAIVDPIGAFAPAATFDLPDLNDLHHAVNDKDGKAASDLTAAEVVKRAEEANGWLAEAQFPADIGKYIAKEIAGQIKKHPAYEKLPLAEREGHRIQAEAQLRKMWGAQYQTNIGLVRGLVQELESRRPGLIDTLTKSGAANNVAILAQVATHLRRLAQQRGITL